MMLRLTREEGEWLRRVMDEYRKQMSNAVVASANRVEREWCMRDRDVAWGMMDAIDEAMARKERR